MSTNAGEIIGRSEPGEMFLGILFFPCMLSLTQFTEHLSVALFGSSLFSRDRPSLSDRSPPLFSHLPVKLTESGTGKITERPCMTVPRVLTDQIQFRFSVIWEDKLIVLHYVQKNFCISCIFFLSFFFFK